ncbi:MAG: hypothetical protein CTY37_04060 [Methylotenera sp.]|nr:MAG: hypothetical protein CTY37_04060 [Methylotenera sp.]
MKSLNLAVLVSTAVLMVSGAAIAEDTYNKNSHHQNFSKRPYHQPLPDSAYQKSNEFEGATLVRGELSEEEAAVNKNNQVLRMNQLSKRPY